MKKPFTPLIATAVVAAAAGAAGGVGLTAGARADAPKRPLPTSTPSPQQVASGETAWVLTSNGVEYCFIYNSRPYCRVAERWY